MAEWPGRPRSKTEISQAEHVTPGYLQHLLTGLASAGLVRSYRGKGGGFALARPPESVTVGEVLHCMEGKVQPAPCEDARDCARAEICPTRPFWQKITTVMEDLLESTTIADLANEHRPSEERLGLAGPLTRGPRETSLR